MWNFYRDYLPDRQQLPNNNLSNLFDVRGIFSIGDLYEYALILPGVWFYYAAHYPSFKNASFVLCLVMSPKPQKLRIPRT